MQSQSPGPRDEEGLSAFVTDLLERALQRVNDMIASVNVQLFDGHEAVTLANVPATPILGEERFCTNCRKIGEGGGAGTGTPIYWDGAAWTRGSDDTVAVV